MDFIGKIIRITASEEWGFKKLPYAFRQSSTRINFRSGYYVYLRVSTDDEQIKKAENYLNKSKDVIRFTAVRTIGGKNDDSQR